MIKQLSLGFLLIGITAIAFAGGKHTGGHNEPSEPVSHWNAPKVEAQKKNPIQRTDRSIASGKAIYMELCSSCHGMKGKGDGPVAKGLAAQPANLLLMAAHHSDGDLAWKIRYGRGDMPGWEDELSRNEIWDTVNYLKIMSARKGEDHHTDQKTKLHDN